MAYPGGKGGAGVYQTIINQIPPHAVYIEPFVGAGGVLRMKRPAARSIAIDLSDQAAALWRDAEGVEFVQGCGIQFLAGGHRFTGREFVYCDPPYLRAVRRSQRDIYAHELGDIDHVCLLNLVRELPCMVAISGYPSDLYDQALSGWRRITFTATTRGGPATEALWMNYPEPVALHDYRYLGADYRERERIKRKVRRWQDKLAGLPEIEQRAILSALADRSPPAPAVMESSTTDPGEGRCIKIPHRWPWRCDPTAESDEGPGHIVGNGDEAAA